MLNTLPRLWLVAAVWLVTVAAISVGSVALDASVSTNVLLFGMCAAPAGLVFLLGWGSPSPTVAEVLHAVHNHKDGR